MSSCSQLSSAIRSRASIPSSRGAINDGCKRIVELADERGVGRLVFTSTCSNYGLRNTDEPADETSDLAPVSLYAELKVDFERFVLDRASQLSLCPVLLRIATAYGLSQRMRFDLTISEFTQTLASGKELVVYDADTWRPYCHIDDISRAIITVLGGRRGQGPGEVFNVGHSDENYTKRMVVDVVQEAIGGDGQGDLRGGRPGPAQLPCLLREDPRQLGFEPAASRPGDRRPPWWRPIQAGIFDDFDARPGFYTNHSVVIPGEDSRSGGLMRAVILAGGQGNAAAPVTRRFCRSRWFRSATAQSSS